MEIDKDAPCTSRRLQRIEYSSCLGSSEPCRRASLRREPRLARDFLKADDALSLLVERKAFTTPSGETVRAAEEVRPPVPLRQHLTSSGVGGLEPPSFWVRSKARAARVRRRQWQCRHARLAPAARPSMSCSSAPSSLCRHVLVLVERLEILSPAERQPPQPSLSYQASASGRHPGRSRSIGRSAPRPTARQSGCARKSSS